MYAIDNFYHNDYVVRAMGTDDLPVVVAIEEQCHDFDAWPSTLFQDCFLAGFPAFVIEKDQQICGFVITSLAADEMQILNIKVAPEFRRAGLASSMLNYCIELCKKNACVKIFLEVRLSNIVAQHLYEKFGFIHNGYRKDYYSAANNTREDALLYYLDVN